jgi:pre-mRNA-splicing factor CWC26
MKRDLAKKKKIQESSQQASEAEQETVYRDATGRKIDTKAERAEAARLKREREEKEAAKMEWGKGIVQKDEEERKRAELALESTRDLAR